MNSVKFLELHFSKECQNRVYLLAVGGFSDENKRLHLEI